MTLVMGGRLRIVEGSEGDLRREVTLTVWKLELSLNTLGPLLRTMKFLLSVLWSPQDPVPAARAALRAHALGCLPGTVCNWRGPGHRARLNAALRPGASRLSRGTLGCVAWALV